MRSVFLVHLIKTRQNILAKKTTKLAQFPLITQVKTGSKMPVVTETVNKKPAQRFHRLSSEVLMKETALEPNYNGSK